MVVPVIIAISGLSLCPECGEQTLVMMGTCPFCNNPDCDLKGCSF